MKLSSLISTALVAASLLSIAPLANASEGQHLIKLAQRHNPCTMATLVKVKVHSLVVNDGLPESSLIVQESDSLYDYSCSAGTYSATEVVEGELKRSNSTDRVIKGFVELKALADKGGYATVRDYLKGNF